MSRQRMGKSYCNSLETSVINSPMSPASLKKTNKFCLNYDYILLGNNRGKIIILQMPHPCCRKEYKHTFMYSQIIEIKTDLPFWSSFDCQVFIWKIQIFLLLVINFQVSVYVDNKNSINCLNSPQSFMITFSYSLA